MPSVIQWLCDVHYARDENVAGESVEIVIDKRPRVIILCNECREQLVDPLAEVLDEHGVTPSKTDKSPSVAAPGGAQRRRADDLPQGMDIETARMIVTEKRCPFTPTHGPFASVSYAMSHLRVMHGTTASELGIANRGGRGRTSLEDLAAERERQQTRPHAQPRLDDDAETIVANGRVADEPPPVIAAAQRDDEKPTCTICGRSFSNKAGLGGHMSNAHGIPGRSPEIVRERERRERLQRDHASA